MIARLREALLHDRKLLPPVVVAVLCLSLPNLVVMFWPRFDHRQAEVFWMGMGVIMLPCLLPITVRSALLLWTPFAAFIPAAVIYVLVTGSALREWAFVVLLETDWRELSRFWLQAAGGIVLAPVSLWAYCCFVSRKVPAGHLLSWPSRMMVITLALALPAGDMSRTGWEFGLLVTQRKLSAIFPAGLAVSGWSAWRIRHQFDGRKTIAREVVVKSLTPAAREIYILVIGESARFASFQINGYDRETTPRLGQVKNLLSFQNVTAPATVTLMSVPVLLTPTRADTLRNAPTKPSVINVFRRAGFHTAWYSTQMKHGMYDTASSIFANDADETQFLSGTFAPGSRPYASAYDGELLTPLRELLARGEPRLFIVLHTMGSHQHYCDRYPPGFNHFPSELVRHKGSFITDKFTDEEKHNLANAYDNSIRYTDWVLSEIINSLAAQHCVSALYYISDHGQNMGDSRILPFAHGSTTPDVIHVPAILWLSDEYRAHRPEQTAALESHVRTPLSADGTFHTLIDLAGLECPLVDRSHSAASTSLKPGKRLVREMSGGIVEFDF